MEDYTWFTENPHLNNEETMNDFINNHLYERFEVIYEDRTMVEIIDENGNQYECHASGNGDFNNHKITFKEIN
jgi:hypothetical protein